MAERSNASRPAIARALSRAALPKDALRAPRLRVSVLQFERYYVALRRAADDELFGYFRRKVPPGAYATLLRLLTGCVDVRAALGAAIRFYRLFDRRVYWHLDVAPAVTTLRLELRDAGQAASIFFVHTMLISPWRTAVWLSGKGVAIEAIRLPPRLRTFAAETRYLFGRDPTFADGPPCLVLPSELLGRPIVREPADAAAYVAASLRSQILAPEETTFERHLRALLFETKPIADLTLDQVAKRMGVSRASLARKLARHGLSFQGVKDELRRDHAITLLTETSQSVAEIAERVGYSAPSAFQRAFRDWTGVSPGRMRKR